MNPGPATRWRKAIATVVFSSGSLLFLFFRRCRQLHSDGPINDLYGIGLHPYAYLGTQHRARLERNLPAMQRAHHGRSADNAVAHRPTAMRAVVIDGREAIPQVENRDIVVADAHAAAFPQRNILSLRDTDPIHCSTLSNLSDMGSICTNWVGLTGLCRSSQASLDKALAFCRRFSSAFL